MSDDEAALLAGILAAPRDDAPRYVYADWLDEHGQDRRAAFIRAQLAHPATLGDALRKRTPIRGRWPALLDRPVWDWDLGRVTVPPTVIVGNKGRSYVGFERGFPAWAYVPWGEWKHFWYTRAFMNHPLVTVHIDQACVTPWVGGHQGTTSMWPSGGYGFQGYPASQIAFMADILPGPYPTHVAAKKALSDALVRQGRAAAGLPEMPA